MAFVVMALVFSLLLAPGTSATPAANPRAEVIFVNVGQGDGVVLRIGGKIVVSDAGETFAAPRMAGVLRSLGAEQIDVAILSHPHDDHVGGFVDLFREFPPRLVLASANRYWNWRDLDWWFAYGLEPWNRFGTRPYRPVWIGALLIALYAVVYAVFLPFRRTAGVDDTREQPPRFFGVLFSIENFVPIVNVSDVKDWGWEPRPSWRGVVASQRVLGFAVTAFAAYSIGSYVL